MGVPWTMVPRYLLPDGSTPTCPRCEERIAYHCQRRFIRHDGHDAWFHLRCLRTDEGLVACMNEDLETLALGDDQEDISYGKAILSLLLVDDADVARAARISRLSPSFMQGTLDKLKENGCHEDGKWVVDWDTDDGRQTCVAITLWILACRGLVVRTAPPEEPATM